MPEDFLPRLLYLVQLYLYQLRTAAPDGAQLEQMLREIERRTPALIAQPNTNPYTRQRLVMEEEMTQNAYTA